MVLEGEPGLGKTTSGGRASQVAQRRSLEVLECRPVQAEAQLSFAALADLLVDVPEAVFDELPGPQRRALDVALLRADPEGDELFPRAVALGFLGAIGALARPNPVVVAIDDVHYLDHASQRVLAFSVRRLRHERIGVLLARRTDTKAEFPNDGEGDARMPVTRLRLAALEWR